MGGNAIYTHDEAAHIVKLFENILDEYDTKIPSPEDYEREPDSEAKLYGSVYWNLMDDIEGRIISLLHSHKPDTEVIEYAFSGNL